MERYLNLPLGGSAHSAEVDFLLGLVHWVMALLFVVWGAYFVIALVRFRGGRRRPARYAGAKGTFSTYGEVGVALVEVALLIGFAVPIWARRVAALPPAERAQAVEVRVVGEQFAWNVHYPGRDGRFGRTDPKLISAGTNPLGLDKNDPAAADDVTTINQLHLPVNRPAFIRLSSKDVIHSFSLPTMRVKQDAIPGMEIPVHFTPTAVTPEEARLPACAAKTDCWEIACAQLCGLSHYRMKGFFTVHDAAGFQAWLDQNAPQPPAPAAPAPTTAP